MRAEPPFAEAPCVRGVEDTLARARQYGQRPIESLAGFPNGKAKAVMVEAVGFATGRGY